MIASADPPTIEHGTRFDRARLKNAAPVLQNVSLLTRRPSALYYKEKSRFEEYIRIGGRPNMLICYYRKNGHPAAQHDLNKLRQTHPLELPPLIKYLQFISTGGTTAASVPYPDATRPSYPTLRLYNPKNIGVFFFISQDIEIVSFSDIAANIFALELANARNRL